MAAALVGELQTGEKEASSEEGNASVEKETDPDQEEQHRGLLHPGRDREGNLSLWDKNQWIFCSLITVPK
jgi:hypothetical protein